MSASQLVSVAAGSTSHPFTGGARPHILRSKVINKVMSKFCDETEVGMAGNSFPHCVALMILYDLKFCRMGWWLPRLCEELVVRRWYQSNPGGHRCPNRWLTFALEREFLYKSSIEGENECYEWTKYNLNIPVRKGSCTQTRCSVNGNLCVPRVNLELWHDLPKESKSKDLGLQELQKGIVKASQPIIQALSAVTKCHVTQKHRNSSVLYHKTRNPFETKICIKISFQLL